MFNETDGPRLSQMPEVGPVALVMTHNDRVEPLSIKDIFEVLRWMREDLRQVHREFRRLDGVSKEMERIKAIHLKQSLMYGRYRKELTAISEQVAAQSVSVKDQRLVLDEQSIKIEEQSRQLDQLIRSIADLRSDVTEHGRLVASMDLAMDNAFELLSGRIDKLFVMVGDSDTEMRLGLAGQSEELAEQGAQLDKLEAESNKIAGHTSQILIQSRQLEKHEHVLESLQGQMATLQYSMADANKLIERVLASINRPWWKKLLGIE